MLVEACKGSTSDVYYRGRLETDPGAGQADRRTGKEEVPGGGVAPAGGRSGPDRGTGLRPDAGASEPFPEEPGSRALPRTRAREKPERVAIPIRVNAPSGRLRSGLRSPTASARGGTPVARLQRPFGWDPLMHRADKTRPTRVRMEARRPTRTREFPPEITALS